jgi:hypothetical protein
VGLIDVSGVFLHFHTGWRLGEVGILSGGWLMCGGV